MAEKKRVYWDACTWIGLINKEPAKFAACEYVIQEAERGNLEIWTSAFTLAEVFKKKCDGDQVGIPTAGDIDFEDFLKKDYIQRVNVDVEVATEARRLLRKYSGILKKPQDAVHLATAILNDLDEMHTYDGDDLTKLNGQIKTKDGRTLLIAPPVLPPPPVEPLSLFDGPDETEAPIRV